MEIRSQQIQPAQYVAPGILPAQIDIGTLLTSIMPLIMLAMVFMMLMPMMKGLSEAFKKS